MRFGVGVGFVLGLRFGLIAIADYERKNCKSATSGLLVLLRGRRGEGKWT